MEKYWISKYALTQGIFEVMGKICTNINEDMISTGGGLYHRTFHGKGKEWHDTKEDAIKRADEMRLKKIESLNKQIKKLESMKFI